MKMGCWCLTVAEAFGGANGQTTHGGSRENSCTGMHSGKGTTALSPLAPQGPVGAGMLVSGPLRSSYPTVWFTLATPVKPLSTASPCTLLHSPPWTNRRCRVGGSSFVHAGPAWHNLEVCLTLKSPLFERMLRGHAGGAYTSTSGLGSDKAALLLHRTNITDAVQPFPTYFIQLPHPTITSPIFTPHPSGQPQSLLYLASLCLFFVLSPCCTRTSLRHPSTRPTKTEPVA